MKRKWGLFFLSLFGIVLGLGLIEVALRIGGVMRIRSNVQLDRRLGWTSPPSLTGPHLAPPTIVFLGDSFTAPQAGYVSKVQKELENKGIRTTILNAGVSGYGTVQELEMWRTLRTAYHPKVVVLAFFGWNDLSDNLGDIYYGPFTNINRPTGDQDGPLIFIRPQSIFRYTWTLLSQHSVVVRLLNYNSLYYHGKQNKVFFWTQPDGWAPFYLPGADPRVEKAYAILEGVLQQLKKETADNSAQLVVVGFDNAFTAEVAYEKQMQKELAFFRYLHIRLPIAQLKAITARSGIPFLDLEEAFMQYNRLHPDQHLYRPPLAGHFTDLGETVAAHTIADFLMRSRLLSE